MLEPRQLKCKGERDIVIQIESRHYAPPLVGPKESIFLYSSGYDGRIAVVKDKRCPDRVRRQVVVVSDAHDVTI